MHFSAFADNSRVRHLPFKQQNIFEFLTGYNLGCILAKRDARSLEYVWKPCIFSYINFPSYFILAAPTFICRRKDPNLKQLTVFQWQTTRPKIFAEIIFSWFYPLFFSVWFQTSVKAFLHQPSWRWSDAFIEMKVGKLFSKKEKKWFETPRKSIWNMIESKINNNKARSSNRRRLFYGINSRLCSLVFVGALNEIEIKLHHFQICLRCKFSTENWTKSHKHEIHITKEWILRNGNKSKQNTQSR